MKPTSLFLTALSLACASSLVAESFYSGPTFFSQRPDETKSLTTVDRFGPVGMAIDLIPPAFTMRIKSIEEGSPAAATGKLKAGQIIESINGAPLKDIDPRIQLGNPPAVTYGNGHLNAGGTAVVTFLMLAKECGADVPDAALFGALRHFYRYAGRGGNPYGDHRPEIGFVDNGKNGNLAFAMAAAAARDNCAITAVYTTKNKPGWTSLWLVFTKN